MKTKTVLIFNLILSAALLTAGLLLAPQFPEQMATHWGANGEVNDYGSQFIGIWLLPLMVAGLTLLLIGLPMIDPKRANIEKFRPFYNIFILLFGIYMMYIHTLTLAWNLGYSFNFNTYILPAFGIFTIFLGRWSAVHARTILLASAPPGHCRMNVFGMKPIVAAALHSQSAVSLRSADCCCSGFLAADNTFARRFSLRGCPVIFPLS